MPWSGLAAGALGAVGSIIGGHINANSAAAQMAQQREFAQNGIRWKVVDAKAAGIHPLAALGAQTFSYNPVMTGDNGISEALGRMGQGIDRAAHAKALIEERALDAELKRAQISNVNAQTDAVRAQAAASKAAIAKTALPPAMPAVNNNKSMAGTTPELIKVTQEAKTGHEPGSNPTVGWLKNTDGSFSVVQGQQAKERLEDDFIGELSWSARNRLMPHLRWLFGFSNKDSAPPRILLPKGAKKWRYSGWNSWIPDYN